MNAKQITITVLIFLVLVLLVQNTQVVTLNIFFWQIEMSRIILIPLVLLLGIIIGAVGTKLLTKKKTI